MTDQVVNTAPLGGGNGDAPPPGTAVVRSLRHVKAVRERHMEELAGRGFGSESRSARAWSWALGETDVAPVTDRATAVPPGRPDIKAEIAVADERMFCGDLENRSDGAAIVLRWLIGEDDYIPVRGPNRGELVGGFGDVVRSLDQIREVPTTLAARQQEQHAVSARGIAAQLNDADYLNGVIATMRWVGHKHAAAPITGLRTIQVTARDLKVERLHAEDVIEQLGNQGAGELLPRSYGVGVVSAVNWLLGDSTTLTGYRSG